MERYKDNLSNGTCPMFKFIQNQHESLKQLDVQNLSRCRTVVFCHWAIYHVQPIRVASSGYLHVPRPFIISSRRTIRVWVLRFVRPQLVSLIIHLQFRLHLLHSCLCS
jgi:hypothetical protein